MKKITDPIKPLKNTSLTLDSYKKLNQGLKKNIPSKSKVQTLGKACLLFGMPILATNMVNAQCSSLSLSNINLPNNGGSMNGFTIDIDSDATPDLRFYEVALCCQGKVLGLNGMSIVRTGGPYTTWSAKRFSLNDPIPGAYNTNTGTKAFWVYNGDNAGQWSPAGTSGFMGIKKGIDYGFIQLTLHSYADPVYDVSFPIGGIGGNSVMAGVCASLPVEFLSFFLKSEGKNVNVLWQTASELNNAGYQVLRSTDGRNFEPIHWEEGSGTADQINSYEYTDEDLTPGQMYYYRLNQVDLDGQSELSPIVSVKIKGEHAEAGEFYPNPVKGSVQIDISATENSDWNATFYDMRGTEIQRNNFNTIEGSNHVPFDVSSLNSGSYFVKFDNGVDRFYKKLIIK